MEKEALIGWPEVDESASVGVVGGGGGTGDEVAGGGGGVGGGVARDQGGSNIGWPKVYAAAVVE